MLHGDFESLVRSHQTKLRRNYGSAGARCELDMNHAQAKNTHNERSSQVKAKAPGKHRVKQKNADPDAIYMHGENSS
jgi:hypothetical protein